MISWKEMPTLSLPLVMSTDGMERYGYILNIIFILYNGYKLIIINTNHRK